MRENIRLTLVVDPRFSGGTSSAVAREIHALALVCKLRVVAISSKLFKGKSVHPLLEEACAATQTPLEWDPAIISADVVALHNPTFLKFNHVFSPRIVCDRLFVVCHENFVRPDGPESFDVAHCLDLIATQTIARKKYLAPISGWNRQCCITWLDGCPGSWAIAPVDWTNICDFETRLPTKVPADKRGRHSRPGLEKFATLPDMLAMFPAHCETVRILGADTLMNSASPDHWDLLPFGAEDVHTFLATIDFFVYFTHPFLQESFGRVIGEALAAGKVVITSLETGATFGDGVISAKPAEVDTIVAAFIANPQAYANQVAKGHTALKSFDAGAFVARFHTLMDMTKATQTSQPRSDLVYDFL